MTGRIRSCSSLWQYLVKLLPSFSASSPALPDRAIDSNYLGEYKKLEEIILERTRTDVGTIQRSWQYLRSQVENLEQSLTAGPD